MNHSLKVIAFGLILTLPACANFDRWNNAWEQPKPFPQVPTPPVRPLVADANGNPGKPVPLTPAGRAAADLPPLLECTSQSCKVNCAKTVALRFRPKWCVYFKEPA